MPDSSSAPGEQAAPDGSSSDSAKLAGALNLGGGLGQGMVDPLGPTRAVMGYTSTTIPVRGIAQDLYEPTITISGTGAIYVAAHVAGAFTTGTPAWISTNGGTAWKQLPIASVASGTLLPVGSAPPGGDEGVIVADDDGHAWMVDMQDGVGMSVQGWCNDGASQCYFHPNAYNNVDAGVCDLVKVGSLATDRPWAAHALVGTSDMLLMVNNGYVGTEGNVAQIGLLDVTPGLPVGAVPPTWNGCVGGGYVDGFIPGAPAMHTTGRFVVPQIQDVGSSQPHLKVITGTTGGGVLTTTTTTAFDVENTGLTCSSNFGFSGISDSGTFYVAAADTSDNKRIKVAATTDGTTFKTGTLATTDPIAFLWITGSQTGEGALVSWAEASGGSCANVAFHAAHVTLSGTGFPQFTDSTTVVTGTSPCGDLMGSAVGPDGNSAVVVFSHPTGCLDTPGPLTFPLKAYIQTSGPTI